MGSIWHFYMESSKSSNHTSHAVGITTWSWCRIYLTWIFCSRNAKENWSTNSGWIPICSNQCSAWQNTSSFWRYLICCFEQGDGFVCQLEVACKSAPSIRLRLADLQQLPVKMKIHTPDKGTSAFNRPLFKGRETVWISSEMQNDRNTCKEIEPEMVIRVWWMNCIILM